MLPEIIQLKRLVEECEIQLSTLARLSKCTPTSIANYIKGISTPTGTRLLAIREALTILKTQINDIIKE